MGDPGFSSYEYACVELEKTLKEEYEIASVWGIFGASCAELGKVDDACDAFQRALEIDRTTQDLTPSNRERAKKYLKKAGRQDQGGKSSLWKKVKKLLSDG